MKKSKRANPFLPLLLSVPFLLLAAALLIFAVPRLHEYVLAAVKVAVNP
ncbi:MAG: hypothetical protein IKS31_09410 [Clostridia bacterium]|nr:hypothetical protein [Clostridia bacterium]MBR4459160.1 hypothetical protein [Clostridia bacterium]